MCVTFIIILQNIKYHVIFLFIFDFFTIISYKYFKIFCFCYTIYQISLVLWPSIYKPKYERLSCVLFTLSPFSFANICIFGKIITNPTSQFYEQTICQFFNTLDEQWEKEIERFYCEKNEIESLHFRLVICGCCNNKYTKTFSLQQILLLKGKMLGPNAEFYCTFEWGLCA